jgi:hypothetical protein
MTLLDQFPRLSAYDPGAVGEGGLDPLGLAAVADRIAERLAPGVRARMSHPRFLTATAVGAIAYQALHGLTADEGKTTVDIAFEWLVVEAIVRYPGNGRPEGLPGNQKAARARAANLRLSRRTYLNGPRVFGFTGVYRPLSRDARVLSLDDMPEENALRLVKAWERDSKLDGFADAAPGTAGSRLRKDITDACVRSLEKGECACPPTGQLLRDLAERLAPREAQASERRVLRDLLLVSEHEIRNELAPRLAEIPAGEVSSVSQRDLARQLLPGSSAPTRRALRAAIDFEDAATALDNSFRRFLAYTVQQHGAVITPERALETPGMAALAPRIGGLVRRAIDSVAALDDDALAHETELGFGLFQDVSSVQAFFDALVARHEQVQAGKKKLSWLDRLDADWTVRSPYRNQTIELSDDVWTHPMRLVTLANLLARTA